MKNLLHFLLVAFLLSSCNSIQKLVDRGEYDEAIYVATKKLANKKKRKTKHVVALEEAFLRINQQDLNRIADLEQRLSGAKWDEIFKLYQAIDKRQNRIAPFLPLISKDGYAAHFQFVNAKRKLDEVALKAADFHYDNAMAFIDEARLGNKFAARDAYQAFKIVDRYENNYKDSRSLWEEAYELGQNRVLLKMHSSADVIIPQVFMNEILSVRLADLNQKWTKYYLNQDNDMRYDYYAIMDIENMDISPEREREIVRTDSKEIEEGWEYVLDENGNVSKDSLGNDIKVPKKVIVTADVVQLLRDKRAFISGRLICREFDSGITKESIPLTVEAQFNDHTARFFGDRRALCDESLRWIKADPIPFPSDFEMTMMAAENLKAVFYDELRSITI